VAADGESAGKSKDRKDRPETADIEDLVKQAPRSDVNELETIPTKVPREGAIYRRAVHSSERS
jgi:hypothetical protein